MEQLRKRRRCLVTDPAGNPCNGLIAGFQQERRFRHPALDHITVHGLADELGKARRKYRAAESHAVAKILQRPGQLRIFVNQLECRLDRRTIGHKIWTIDLYRPKGAGNRSCPRRADGT
jgi:hypothetical protein